MRYDIISDTHGHLSPELLRALEGADFIVHAGDICSGSDWRTLCGLADEVHACLGNNDFANSHEVKLRLGYYECVAEASGYPRPPETHPSNAWLVGLTYPFRTVSHNGAVLPFYGDWPVPSA